MTITDSHSLMVVSSLAPAGRDRDRVASPSGSCRRVWTGQNEFAKGSFGREETSQNADCRLLSASMTGAGEIADCRMQNVVPAREISRCHQNAECRV